jgi:hypothetical protein
MHNEYYEDALNEWVENHDLWLKGKHKKQLKYPEETKKYKYYAEWEGNPPGIEYYIKEKKEKTWFQFYENVTEGTPLSPPFETKEELIEWLCNNKDFWDYGPMTLKQATNLLKNKWALSGVIFNGELMTGIEFLGKKED